MSGAKIIRVKNLLGELLHAPGGVSRDEAVLEARKLIEELRDECEKAIPGEITMLEDFVALAGASISVDQLKMILDVVDPLLTLSGTFGSSTLDAVVKKFCDLAAGMREKNVTAVAPLQVHLRAMWLVWNNKLGEAEAAEILAELQLIHAHYGIEPHAAEEPSDLEKVLAEAAI